MPSPLRSWHLWVGLGVNLGIIAGLWLGRGLDGISEPGGWQIAVGQLTALYGTCAILGQIVLVSRVPWLERWLGMDRLNRLHRWGGFLATCLLVGHAVFTTWGYGISSGVSFLSQTGDFILTWPDVLAAMVALGLILMVAATSIRAARRSFSYETWWVVHLYAYLAVVLGFAHQFAVGSDFVDSLAARVYWGALYVLTGVLILGFRWILPVLRGLRHRLRIVAVHAEAPGVVSVVVGGRRLDRWPVESGQFFLLRFLTRDRWWKAHPISLSAAPDGRTLRFTIKALGDDTSALQHIQPGTRLIAEGPYGAFTEALAGRRKLLLIGGGIGITPIRALFESLRRAPGEVTLLYRARNRTEAVFMDELMGLSRERGFTLRVSYSQPFGQQGDSHPFAPDKLRSAVPDLDERDVFVCGPNSLISAATNGLRAAGVKKRNIHAERFDY